MPIYHNHLLLYENFQKDCRLYQQKDDLTTHVESYIVKMQMAFSTDQIRAYAQKGLELVASPSLKRTELFLLINAPGICLPTR